MASFLKSYLVVLHAVIFAVISASWFFSGSAYQSLKSAYTEYKADYIENIDVVFENNKVFLNIRVRQMTTCKKVLSDLRINNILVGANTYRPECSIIDSNHFRIVYTKINEL